MKQTVFDYIVIGAGSAGCAASYRIAQRSVGSVHMATARPEVPPSIQLNLLNDPEDLCHRLRAVRKLREILARSPIADASIMPDIVSGNTHAPSVMIGDKLANLVRQ